MVSDSIEWLKEINKNEISKIGYKANRLSEVLFAKFAVPRAFVITTQAYFSFIQQNGIKEKINNEIKNLDYNNKENIIKISKKIKTIFLKGNFSNNFKAKLEKTYNKLGEKKIGWLSSKIDSFVAIRVSLASEEISQKNLDYLEEFGGFLNVKGINKLIEHIKNCFSSIYCEDALEYKNKENINLEKIGIAIIIQNMINAKSSGIMITSKKIGENQNTIIEAISGYGGSSVIKEITPDHYEIKKKNLEIIKKNKVKQKWQLKRILGKTEKTNIPLDYQNKQKLKDRYIKELTAIAKKLELYFGVPQYVEWGLEDAELFLITSKPLDPEIRNKKNKAIQEKLNTFEKKLIIKGIPTSQGIVIGNVKVIYENSNLENVEKNTIAVLKMSKPSMTSYLKKTKGIILEFGSSICHASLIAKKYGIPCIVNTKNATTILKDSDRIQINGKTGEVYRILTDKKIERIVYKEKIKTELTKITKKKIDYPKIVTKIIVKINSTEEIKKLDKNEINGIVISIKSLFSDYEINNLSHFKESIINNIKDKLNIVLDNIEDKTIYYKIILNKENLKDISFLDYEIEALLDLKNKYNKLHVFFENVKSENEIKRVSRLLSSKVNLGITIEDISKKSIIEKYFTNNLDFIVLNSDYIDDPKELKDLIKICKNKKIKRIINIQKENSYKDIKYFVELGVNGFFIDENKIEIKYKIYKKEQEMLKNLLSV